MSEVKMTIGDCRVLSNKIAQHLQDTAYVCSKGTEDLDSHDISEHQLTGIIAVAVNEYFGVKQ